MADPSALDLRPLHLPPEVDWWPPAPGWWLLVLLLAAVVGLWLRHRHRRGAARRAARRELADLAAAYRRDGDPSALATGLSRLLRRAAMRAAGRRRAAGLTGEAWLRFLDRTGDTDAFTRGPGRALVEAPYRPRAGCDPEGLLAAAGAWIEAVL